MRTTLDRAASAPADVRLTSRGRLVLLMVAVCFVLLASVAIASSVLAASGSGERLRVVPVTVQPGQTLWDIARSSGARGDLRDAVYDIEQLNHLRGADLQIGQRLDVPLPG